MTTENGNETVTQYIREYSSKYGHISADDLAAEMFPPDTPIANVEAILDDLAQAGQVTVSTGAHSNRLYTWVEPDPETKPFTIRGSALEAIQHFPQGAYVREIAAIAPGNPGLPPEDLPSGNGTWLWAIGGALVALTSEGKITRVSRGFYSPQLKPKRSGRPKSKPKSKSTPTPQPKPQEIPDSTPPENGVAQPENSVAQFAHFLIEQQIVTISQAQMEIALNYFNTFRGIR